MNEIELLKKELEREKAARAEAERFLKEKSSVFSEAKDQLQKAYEDILSRVKIFEIGISSTKELLEDEIKRRQTTEALYQAIVNTAIDAIITINAEGDIETINNATLQIFGYEREELVGQKISVLLDTPDSFFYEESIKKDPVTHIPKATGVSREVTGKHKNGSTIPLHLGMSEVKLGNHQFFTGILRDIRDIKNAERKLDESRQQERQIAWEIQRNLLFGKIPLHLPDIHICAFSVPSKEISGDFFDFIKHNDHCFDVIIGDVMGKGVPAALIGAAVKSQILRSIAQISIESGAHEIPSVSAILEKISSGMYADLFNLERFVTLCYARFDMDEQKAVFVDCGHTKTIFYHDETHQSEMVAGDNLPLGVLEGDLYKEVSVHFSMGDIFFFYTDGLTETKNSQEEMYGENRLEQYIFRHHDFPVNYLLEYLNDEIYDFREGTAFYDDFSCIALKIGPSEDPSCLNLSSGEFMGTTAELRKIREFLSCKCMEFAPDLDAGVLDQIILAAQEASTNIIKYAYKNQKNKSFAIRVEMMKNYLITTFRYIGESFDPTTVSPPVMDGSKDHGFGVYIISQLMDSVRYFSDEQGYQCIRLMKKWRE